MNGTTAEKAAARFPLETDGLFVISKSASELRCCPDEMLKQRFFPRNHPGGSFF